MMLATHVHPEFLNPHGYMRARVCWVLRQFGEVNFKNIENLRVTMEFLRVALSTDKELPVRIEAAIGLQTMLTEQEDGKTTNTVTVSNQSYRFSFCSVLWLWVLMFWSLSLILVLHTFLLMMHIL